MRFVVGQSLMAFGLFMAVGCALPDRTMSQSSDFGYRSKDSPNSDVSREPPTTGKISFKAPQRKSQSAGSQPDSVPANSDPQLGKASDSSTKGDAASAELTPGHSPVGSTGAETAGGSSDGDSSKTARVPTDKSSSGQSKIAGKDREEQHSTIDRSRLPVTQVNDRLVTDETTNPIQLRGLEFDNAQTSNDPLENRQTVRNQSAAKVPVGESTVPNPRDTNAGSRIQNWSERPVNRSLEQSAITRTSSSAQAVPNKDSGLADTSQLDAIPKPAGQLPALPWQSDLEKLISRVEQSLAGAKPESKSDLQNEYLRKQAHLRLLYLMAQRQEDALAAIPGLDPSQQEYWQQMIWTMSNSFDTVQFPDLNERAAQTVTPLSAALRLMREEAALSIKNMTFCRKISYFGNYERFPRNEFTPGYEVLLYTEIENFVSTPTVDGEYRTSLKSQIEITDSKGKVVWTKGFPPTEDFCRNPRRDYFHNYQFHIPEDLATGTYSLKLTIVDELSHKRVSNSLNFVLK